MLYYWKKRIKQGAKYKTKMRLEGKTVLITGGNSGVGKSTAIEFAKLGAKVIIASRNVQKSRKAKMEIIAESGNFDVFAMHLDLENFESITSFVKEFDDQQEYLHYLINNAGAVGVHGLSESGYHRVFVINHLGPFLLTHLLMKKMKKQSLKDPVRIVNVSSNMYIFGKFNLEDIRTDAIGLISEVRRYAQTKLANIYFTRELNKRLEGFNITTYAVHPGTITTDIWSWSNLPYFLKVPGNHLVRILFLREPIYAAQTILYCSLDDEVTRMSGEYFKDCAREELWEVAKDEAFGETLWEASVAATEKYLTRELI